MIKLAEALAGALERISGALYVVALALLSATVVLRYVFSISFDWLEEIILLTVIYAVFVGTGAALYHRRHIRIEFFPEIAMSKKAQQVTMLATNTLGALMSTLLVVLGVWLITVDQRLGLHTVSSLQIPMSLIHAVLPIGMTFMALFYTLKAVRGWYELKGAPKEQ